MSRDGRPRSWGVYYVFNEEGTIYHIFCSIDEVQDPRMRKFKSLLSKGEAALLLKIMKNHYGIDIIDIVDEIPDKLKYLSFPPKTHRSRLNEPWNKGISNERSGKTYSVRANNKVRNKKHIWLNNTFKDKSCIYCHESERSCLRYYPLMQKIKAINNSIGLTEDRDHLIKLINEQDVVCLNCESKLNIGLELI